MAFFYKQATPLGFERREREMANELQITSLKISRLSYKALIVDGSGDGYLKTVYCHGKATSPKAEPNNDAQQLLNMFD